MPPETKVIEGWSGPGRCDSVIEPIKPADDGLHIDMGRKGLYEWWYFDAHLENGYIVVIFFHASNPNPGLQGKTGMEIVILRPDGHRVQKFFPYSRSQFRASQDKPEVTIGQNTLRVEQVEGQLPVYEIKVEEEDMGCQLRYTAQVNGWKPGAGVSQFGNLGHFGWVIPFARASVTGTITDGEETIPVSGIGYHDHNWLNFPFQSIIEYWMWGRVYSESFTVSYAYIQCNKKVDRHTVQVLMLAEGEQVILSTGEYEFIQDAFEYNPTAKHRFPKEISIRIPNQLDINLKMKVILEAQDMLDNFNPFLRFIAKNFLRIKPGYFRLVSDFKVEVTREGELKSESGTTLHEIVLFKPVQERHNES